MLDCTRCNLKDYSTSNRLARLFAPVDSRRMEGVCVKAVQIDGYGKTTRTVLRDVPIPDLLETEVLVRVKAAAVNPVDLLILAGDIKLIQDYPMPLTLGNECSGIVEKVGGSVSGFNEGDRVYARMPVGKIGAFAEYAAIDQSALARIPEGYGFETAAAIPLTGLTAYQGLVEELKAKPGETVLISGGSGSFGQMAVPIAKSLGLRVFVTGNDRAKERFLAMGVERYLDYRKENYWEELSGVDYVIDALGAKELEHELSVLKRGGCVLSLKAGPNKAFAKANGVSGVKGLLFSLAGRKFDSAARKQGKEYRFMFVRSDGEQLRRVTEIVEEAGVSPSVDPRVFGLAQIADALELVARGRTDGKVVVRV